MVFAFETTRAAIVGERALLDAGLDARVMPRPASLGEGCGICLRVPDGDGEAASAALRAAGAPVQGVFRKLRVNGATIYENADTQ